MCLSDVANATRKKEQKSKKAFKKAKDLADRQCGRQSSKVLRFFERFFALLLFFSRSISDVRQTHRLCGVGAPGESPVIMFLFECMVDRAATERPSRWRCAGARHQHGLQTYMVDRAATERPSRWRCAGARHQHGLGTSMNYRQTTGPPQLWAVGAEKGQKSKEQSRGGAVSSMS